MSDTVINILLLVLACFIGISATVGNTFRKEAVHVYRKFTFLGWLTIAALVASLFLGGWKEYRIKAENAKLQESLLQAKIELNETIQNGNKILLDEVKISRQKIISAIKSEPTEIINKDKLAQFEGQINRLVDESNRLQEIFIKSKQIGERSISKLEEIIRQNQKLHEKIFLTRQYMKDLEKISSKNLAEDFGRTLRKISKIQKKEGTLEKKEKYAQNEWLGSKEESPDPPLPLSSGETTVSKPGYYNIGCIAPLTGPLSEIGRRYSDTLNLLSDQVNDEGVIKGGVRVQFADSNGRIETAVFAARNLIEHNVTAIIGPYIPGAAPAISELAQASRTPIVITSHGLSSNMPVIPFVFQSAPDDSIRINKFYQSIKERFISEIALFGPYEFDKLRLYLERALENFNIRIIDSHFYSKLDTQDRIIPKYLEFLERNEIFGRNKAVLFYDHFPEFTSERWDSVRRYRNNLLYILFPKIVELNTSQTFPKNSNFRILTPNFLFSRFMTESQRNVILSFSRAYSERFGRRLSHHEIAVYDAFMILKTAIENVGFNKLEIKDFIENLKEFQGATGIFNFTSSDHNGLSSDIFQFYAVNEDNGCLDALHKCSCDYNECADSEDDCKCN